MAIYHLSAKVISRADGRSAVAAAAYRSASELQDERLGRAHDFTNKAGVIHSEILLPEGAPERLADRATLWNTVEAVEKRKDAQLAREIEIALPRELTKTQAIELARDFVQEQFVAAGMIADLNVHWGRTADGEDQPHAHIMLTMREVGLDGFGKKARDWNRTELLVGWRQRWAEMANERLAEFGYDLRIDHRSQAAQGIELEPQNKIGPAGARREARGEDAERAAEHAAVAGRNGARIVADPSLVLAALTQQQSTFTRRDQARLVNRHTADAEQFAAAMAAVDAAPELVRLGCGRAGRAPLHHPGHAGDRAAHGDGGRRTRRAPRASRGAAAAPVTGRETRAGARAGAGVPARDPDAGSDRGGGLRRNRQEHDAGYGAGGVGGRGLPGSRRGAVRHRGRAAGRRSRHCQPDGAQLAVPVGAGARDTDRARRAGGGRGRDARFAADGAIAVGGADGRREGGSGRRPGAAAGDRGRGGVPGDRRAGRRGGDHRGAPAAGRLAAGRHARTGHRADGFGAGALRGRPGWCSAMPGWMRRRRR